ncbi:MAG: PEP-CTERM sorting domain-containing protein [Planctomycetota bacterium]
MIASLSRQISLPAILFGLAISQPAMASIVVYDEDFDYANSTELQASWTDASGSAYSFFLDTDFTSQAAGQTVTPLAGSPVARLNNDVVYDTLDETVTEDWTLSFKALSSSYRRGQFVALMNAAGTQGYAVQWDTANVNQFSGEGAVRLRKFDFAAPWTTFSLPADNTQLANFNESGHPATGFEVIATSGSEQADATYASEFAGFAEFELTWEKDTGTLTLLVNGEELGSAVDTDFTSFSRVYLRGNTNLIVDEIVVTTIPEPGSLGLMAAGLACILGRRRRSPDQGSR